MVVRDELVEDGGDVGRCGHAVAERHAAGFDLGAPSGEQVHLDLAVVVADADGGFLVGQGDVPCGDVEVSAVVGDVGEASDVEDFFDVANGCVHV